MWAQINVKSMLFYNSSHTCCIQLLKLCVTTYKIIINFITVLFNFTSFPPCLLGFLNLNMNFHLIQRVFKDELNDSQLRSFYNGDH